ncbi:hypothetical protein GCM10007079_04560 [Nocardiopsis terrae]|uniref:Integral membrane protein n=1 Tax=Nocardiopsis terrae TaxID=372655 RepID=A0ABR9HNA2_9ACTN|nr:hypothetical protein [Nocardiopsis terrae]MBE1460510.1 hypothetical protein [Nocardiopsis terrae]GHC71813.1 hypothetical protein GCM10007079_04560 [Nocardiopsis terrae]
MPGRPSLPFSVVLLLLAAAVAHVGLSGFDQSLRAARGEGVPGVFTAVSLSCVQHPGHESCTCNGTFLPEVSGGLPEEDGQARSVYLHAAGRDTCREGGTVPAVDAGAANRVYGPDGSREWLFSLFLVAGPVVVAVGVALVWARWALSGPRRRSAR